METKDEEAADLRSGASEFSSDFEQFLEELEVDSESDAKEASN